MGKSTELWVEAFRKGVREDAIHWDWTTRSTLENPAEKIRAKVIAKSPGVFVGRGLLDLLGEEFTIESKCQDGDAVKKGEVVARWHGPAEMILAYERTFLNLVGFFSGIATRTRDLVDRIEAKKLKTAPRLTCTRKTLPYYKDLSVHSVIAGGGAAHRLNLASGILIKENHIAAAGGIRSALSRARTGAPHGLKIEVEVRNLNELKVAMNEGADGALLDHFTPQDAKKAASICEGQKFFLEVSGNIDETNIKDYAIEGIHVISSGALTHSVKSLDLSLLVEGA